MPSFHRPTPNLPHASEEQFRLLVEQVQDYAIFMLDPEGRVVTWNIGAQRIKGYQPQEVIGSHFSRFYTPEDLASRKPARALQTAAAAGRFEDEGWRVRKDGTLFWASVVITALYDEAGQLRGFAKVTRDLTERRKAEEAARQLAEAEAARRVAERDSERLRRLQAISETALASLDLESLLERLPQPTAHLLEADSAAILLLEGEELVPRAAWAMGEEDPGAVVPLSREFAERVARERRPVALESAEKRLPDACVSGARGLLGVPLLRDGRLLGVLQVGTLETRAFGSDDVTLLQLLADRVALAMDHARLYCEAQEEIRLREEAENALKMPFLVLEHMVEGVSLADADGVLIYTNPAEDAMFGYQRGELIGKHVSVQNDYPPEENQQRVQAAIDQLNATGVCTGEWRNRRKDGSSFTTRARITALQFAGSKHFVCVQEDVTEQKRAQEELRQSEERFRTLVAVLPHLVWVARADGWHEYCNRRWYAYTGLTEEESAGSGWLEAIHPEDREYARESWSAAIQTGEPYEVEHRLRAADGTYRWFLSRALPLRDSQGKVTRWFGTCTDIHDQRLAQDQLRESDRQKDEFLAMLAHELRNPLAPIRNAVRVLHEFGSRDPRVARQRAVIDRQSQHMARLLDDLLDVSRITRGKIELRKEPLDLGLVLGQVVDAHRGMMDERGHRLSVSVPEEPLYVSADPTRLHQIIGNLLTNAVKYTEPGGEISLSLWRENGEAVVRVTDNGAGIAPDFLPHIFDLFAQGDRSLLRGEAGLGIGLTMVKRLAELHGGSVTARSEGLGRGSEFVVRLPLLAGPLPSAPSRLEVMPRKEPERSVLIVDDNRDSAETLAELVSLWGHRAFAAHSGAQALRLAEEVLPDVVILDIAMPHMDGYEVARRLRQNPALQDTVLVALTGYGQEEDRRRAEAAGFDCHLTKPVDLELLPEILAANRTSAATLQDVRTT